MLSATRDWPCQQFTDEHEMLAAMKRAVELLDPDDYLFIGDEIRFRTVAAKDRVIAPEFERSNPRWRVYLHEDGTMSWHEVLADNTVGEAITDTAMIGRIGAQIDPAWAADFWRAARRHGKATLYGAKANA